AIVVEPRMSAYAEASKAVYRVFEDTTPLVEGLSIDEAFLDVRGLERLSGTPLEIAVRLREQVRVRVGLPITVGVARTKFLANVAMDAVVVGLVDRVTRRMRTARRVGRTVVLRLRFADFSRATRSQTLLQSTAETQTILAVARCLLASAMPMVEAQGLTLVGVAVA